MKMTAIVIVAALIIMTSLFLIRISLVNAQPPPSWTEDIRVTNAYGDSRRVAMAIGPTGNIHLAFDDTAVGYPQVYYTQLDQNGDTRIPMMRVSFDADNAQHADITVDANDDAFIVWDEIKDMDSLHWDLHAAKVRGADGRVLIRKRLVQDGESLFPSIAMDRRIGEMHIMWQKRNGVFQTGPTGLYFARTDNNLNFITPLQAAQTSYAYGAVHPQATVDADGFLHAVWSFGGTEYVGRPGIYARYTDRWISNEIIFSFLGEPIYRFDYTLINVNTPKFTIDAQNNVHIVFANSKGYVGYTKILNRQPVVTPRIIYTPTFSGGDAYNIDVTADDQGRAHIVFNTRGSQPLNYYVLNTDGTILSQTTLDHYPYGFSTRFRENPVIAFRQGKTYFAWNDDRFGAGNNEIFLKIKS